jgi:hypothetical protein
MHPTDHIQIVTFRLAGLPPGESRAAMEDYLHGPIFGGLRADLRIGSLMSRDLEVEAPTQVTRRRVAPTALPAIAPSDRWAA